MSAIYNKNFPSCTSSFDVIPLARVSPREKLQKAEETSASDLQMEPEVIDHNVNPQKRKIR
jgi:hypothetical protein